MPTFIKRIPVTVTEPTLGFVDLADILDLSAFEQDAAGHWIFDRGDNGAYTNPLSGAVLTENGTPPTFNKGYIAANTDDGNFLETAFVDTETAVDTTFCVFRHKVITNTLRPLFGTLGSSTGGGLYINNGDVTFNYRGAVSSSDVYQNVPRDLWYFALISRDFSGATNALKGFVGGQPLVNAVHSGAYDEPTTGNVKISLGNPNFSTTPQVVDFAEFGHFKGKFMTDTEIAALYARTKARLALSGIAVT